MCLITAIVCIIICCVILIPQIKQREKLDEDIRKQNTDELLKSQSIALEQAQLRSAINEAKSELDSHIQRNKELSDYVQQCKDTAAQEVEAYRTLKMDQMGLELRAVQEEYQKAINDYEKEYEDTLLSYANDLSDYDSSRAEQLQKLNNTILQSEVQLNDLRNKVRAAVDAAKREQEIAIEQDFYKMVLSQEDLEEIAKLKTVIPYLRNAEPLNKVIWKVYYEKPCSDLIGRVVGADVKTGIYKITNIQNKMCYVGQAVKLAGEKLFSVATEGLLFI